MIREILSVLAEDPFGEMRVTDVKSRVVQRMSSPEILARRLRDATDRMRLGQLPQRMKLPDQDVFGRFISTREAGIWKITEAGRSYLKSLGDE